MEEEYRQTKIIVRLSDSELIDIRNGKAIVGHKIIVKSDNRH